MKYYRVRDKVTKKYLSDHLRYYCNDERMYANDFGLLYKSLPQLKYYVEKMDSYTAPDEHETDGDGDTVIYPNYKDRFEIVECYLVDSDSESSQQFRIKDTLSNKYYTGRNSFDNKGKLYSSRGGANIALSRKSKSKVSQRGTKAGAVLYMKPEWGNCEIVGVGYKNTKVIK